MKLHQHLLLLAGLTFTHAATAQDLIKANNTQALNLPASWVGGSIPGVGNVAVWNSTVTAANTTILGANLTWKGIRIDNPGGGNVNINGTNTLTLGSSGITVNNRSLTLAPAVVFSADSAMWFIGTAAIGMTFNSPTNLAGHTLTIAGNRDSQFIAGSGGLSSGSLLYTDGTSNNGQCQFNAASTGDFNLFGSGSAQIIVNHTAASNPQLNLDLDDASRIRLGTPFDNGTFQIGNLTGIAGTRIIPDYGVTSGQPAVVRTLSVNQITDGAYAGLLTGSNNNRTLGLTKTGGATLTLTNPVNEYSGPTTINAGTLRIAEAGRLNYRPVPTGAIVEGIYPAAITNNATFHIDSTAIQALSGTMTGTGTLLKSNTGFLTYGGNGSGFTGETMVNAGRLILNGSLGGNVSLGSGASLAGTGTSTRDLATAANASLILTGGAATTALTFDAATLGGPTYVEFASPQNATVVYDVLTYGAGGLTGYANIIPLARGSLSHDTANHKVVFTAEAPGIRTWNTGDGVWNSLKVLQNWAGGDKVFYQGDQAVFNAIASDTAITLEALLAPSTVTVQNASNTYTFAGSGGLVGNGIFNKSATGILEIANSNAYFAGPTSINAGIFRFIDGGSWGTGPITNNAALEIDSPSDLTLINGIAGTGTLIKRGSGTLRLDGPAENTFTGNVTVASGRLILVKPTSLGTSPSGDKTITIAAGAQLELNNFAIPGRTHRNTDLLYSCKIAGNGDGTGALVNNHGTSGISYFAGVLNLELMADATIGGMSGFDAGYYYMGKTLPGIAGVITGNGHTLTKAGTNEIHLRGPASNLTIVVNEGLLGGEGDNDCFGGSVGSVTVHTGAALGARGAQNNPLNGPLIIPTPITFQDGTTLQDLDGGVTTWSGQITLAGTVTIFIPQRDMIITGTVGGNGGIVKTGIKTLTLTASNTCTGPTTVSEGTVIIQYPYLSNTAAVTLATGDTLNLDFTGTDAVGSLTLGGQIMGPGIYNATTHPGLLAGTGALQVSAISDYGAWSGSTGFNLTGGPNGDDDGDGLSNLKEYAFGLNPTNPASVNSATPPDKAAGIFTYTRRKPTLTGLGYIYQSSTTLSAWTPFTPPVPDSTNNGNPVETITVTLPAALLAEPELFLQVEASGN